MEHIGSERDMEYSGLGKGLMILQNLSHRGATGCDETTGDGAGIMIQIPHEFFKKKWYQF